LKEGKHADIPVVVILPICQSDDAGELTNQVITVGRSLLLKIVTFEG